MNKRLSELITEVGIYQPERFNGIDGTNQLEKFAQLIAQECMDIAKKYTTRPYEMGMNEKTRTAWNIYMDISDRFKAYNEQQI